MFDPVVKTDSGVTLLGGGLVEPTSLAVALALAPCVVAADGGADRALAAGLMPVAVIGDMDSISPEATARIAPERLHLVAEQHSTDFRKCLDRIAAPFVIALGFGGPRLDHFLAVLNALVAQPNPPALVLTETEVIAAIPPGRGFHLPLVADTPISLFPLTRLRGSSQGLRWPIDGLEFDPMGRIGTSNLATGPVTLRINAVGMLVILPSNCLSALIAALAGR